VSESGPADAAYQRERPYLFSVAYRMTGSASDAEDLVQDAWVRYLDAGSPSVNSLRAYLTTIVSRLALDYLKSARVQRERYIGPWMPEPVLTSDALPGPEESAEQREEISIAFLTLIERLEPEQRVVYVLREGFGLSYEDIGHHLGRSAAACRQMFHRIQRRLSAERLPAIAAGSRHQDVIEQFLTALSTGQVDRVAELLRDDAVWIADGGPNHLAARRPIVGADRIARGLVGLLSKAPPEMRLTWTVAPINGAPALVIRDRGRMNRIIALDVRDGRIGTVRIILNPDKLRHLDRSLQNVLPLEPGPEESSPNPDV